MAAPRQQNELDASPNACYIWFKGNPVVLNTKGFQFLYRFQTIFPNDPNTRIILLDDLFLGDVSNLKFPDFNPDLLKYAITYGKFRSRTSDYLNKGCSTCSYSLTQVTKYTLSLDGKDKTVDESYDLYIIKFTA